MKKATDLASHTLFITDKELLDKLAAGDQGVFRTLIDTYFPILCRFAEKFLPDSSLAEDIVQEVFIKFWDKKTHFQHEKALKSYLFTATKNGCFNYNRSRSRQADTLREAFVHQPNAVDPVIADIIHLENIASIYRILQGLPETQQQIFRLSYEEGLTVMEISAQLDMKVKAVRNHKYKLLVLLRNKLGRNSTPLLLSLFPLLQHS